MYINVWHNRTARFSYSQHQRSPDSSPRMSERRQYRSLGALNKYSGRRNDLGTKSHIKLNGNGQTTMVLTPQKFEFVESNDTVKDVYGRLLSIEICKLRGKASFTTSIKSANKNGKTLTSSLLILNISLDHQFLFLEDCNTIVDNFVVHIPKQLKRIRFENNYKTVLIELNDKKGYINVSLFANDGKALVEDWEPLKPYIHIQAFSTNQLHNVMSQIDNERFNPSINTTPNPSKVTTPNKSYHSISPETAYSNNATNFTIPEVPKSLNADPLIVHDINEIPRETPAPFNPPLEHKFSNGQSITISYNDFKTLYNNDWVNDTIIDFFTNYEIEKAIKQGSFTSTEIYAFNSFFFLKLMGQQQPSEDTEVDYYGNVKRWLSKIDLFSYDTVIIPINELFHWYGSIIVGLPEFLKRAKQREPISSSTTSSPISSEPLTTPEETHSIQEDFQSNSNELKQTHHNQGPISRFPDKVNIFVFDSLSKKHTGLHKPFRQFLMSYCKDKYGIEMTNQDIVFRSTKVPKQKNFNDCGIHVIYNIRKLLHDRFRCLRIWDQNSASYKGFFVGSERSQVRKELIDLLLTLKSKVSKSEDVVHLKQEDSDEEIEFLDSKHIVKPVVISKTNERGKHGARSINVTIDTKHFKEIGNLARLVESIDEITKPQEHKPQTETEMPKQLDTENQLEVIKLLLQNTDILPDEELINRKLKRDKQIMRNISPTSKLILNKFFQHNGFFTTKQLNSIIAFKHSINDLRIPQDTKELNRRCRIFKHSYDTLPLDETRRQTNIDLEIQHDETVLERPSNDILHNRIIVENVYKPPAIPEQNQAGNIKRKKLQ